MEQEGTQTVSGLLLLNAICNICLAPFDNISNFVVGSWNNPGTLLERSLKPLPEYPRTPRNTGRTLLERSQKFPGIQYRSLPLALQTTVQSTTLPNASTLGYSVGTKQPWQAFPDKLQAHGPRGQRDAIDMYAIRLH